MCSRASDKDTFCREKASEKTKICCDPAAMKSHKDRYDLPSHDALAQILPDYRDLRAGVKPELPRAARVEQERPAARAEAAQAKKNNINHTFQVRHPHNRPPLHDFEDDPHVAEINDLWTKEVENYRSAMSRMADDIVALRTQVLTLEAEKSQLRSDLSLHQDLGQNLLDDTDIDVMTKAEIADRIASLKFKLANATSTASSQRTRIQQLQNELIRKNDSEEKLLKLQRDQQQQQEDPQHHRVHLAKMAVLEATVKRQEKVIQKMEDALNRKFKEENEQTMEREKTGAADGGKTEAESALAAENARLREELDRRRRCECTASVQTKTELLANEKLSLQTKLENAELRVQTLEAQLKENSKLWGRQKQEMLTKLNEFRHGFVRTSTTILHNLPSSTISHSLHQQNRQRKQKPMK